MSQRSKRAAILDAGLGLVRTEGFGHTGVAAISAAAGAPKGSFYNHFASKEAFGIEVLDAYFATIHLALDTTFRSASNAETGLREYFEHLRRLGEKERFAIGCLIGNLSAETAPISERLRAHLLQIISEWRALIADGVRSAQRRGTVRTDVEASVLAGLLVDAWQGALLRAKVERTPDALDCFLEVTLPSLLGLAR